MNGTTWEYSETRGDDIVFKSVIVFRAKTYIYEGFELTGSHRIEFSGIGTYVYESPNLIMRECDDVITATISGNKKTIPVGGRWVRLR